MTKQPSSTKDQVQKFREAARKHEADESEDAFNAALKAVTAHKNRPQARSPKKPPKR